MLKSLFKLLLMIIMLVAFVGQTVAYQFVASYDESSAQHTASEKHTSSEHTDIQQPTPVNEVDSANNGNNAHTSETDDDCCYVECCESECICPANACASFAYLDNSLPLSEPVVLSEPLLSLVTKGTRFIARSLFRPPIFTS